MSARQSNEAKAAHLHALALLYCDDGQTERGLLFLMLADLILPGDPRILRSLAALSLSFGAADRALAIVSLLERMDGSSGNALTSLRKRALHASRPKAPLQANAAIRLPDQPTASSGVRS